MCHERRLGTTVHNCTRDEGGPFEVDNQVLISSHRKLLWSKAMVVSVAEKPKQDLGVQLPGSTRQNAGAKSGDHRVAAPEKTFRGRWGVAIQKFLRAPPVDMRVAAFPVR